MPYLIPAGTVVTLVGLVLLVVCMLKIGRAKKAGLSDDEMRAVLQSVVPMNLAALLLSGLGLMVVVLGIILG